MHNYGQHVTSDYILLKLHLPDPTRSATVLANQPDDVQLDACANDVILPTSGVLLPYDSTNGVVDMTRPCNNVTSLFQQFCDARVRCSFNQTQFRAEAERPQLCGRRYRGGVLMLSYHCLSGK